MIAPKIEKMAEDLKADVVFLKVDVDENEVRPHNSLAKAIGNS